VVRRGLETGLGNEYGLRPLAAVQVMMRDDGMPEWPGLDYGEQRGWPAGNANESMGIEQWGVFALYVHNDSLSTLLHSRHAILLLLAFGPAPRETNRPRIRTQAGPGRAGHGLRHHWENHQQLLVLRVVVEWSRAAGDDPGKALTGGGAPAAKWPPASRSISHRRVASTCTGFQSKAATQSGESTC
jgi:hypothetical protein